ncbi:hypothetical protein [[Mycobacterium] burgundiense]|uniref:DUF4190 domain-containing protein n=1 Tax=[Mycobacterium] burgundiense TaxID=3064286 RepID=A0ABM9L9F1_9MYCO|nr:hypothetical protein [Mycolicibacterium sp. MU0053]CAJ1495089.1 hypothetical protein MU0053_000266 [Mycolicibacterium sp. MU0053]
MSETVPDPAGQRYSAATFLASMGSVLVAGVGAWTFIPWWPLGILGLPLLLIDLVVGVILVTRPGTLGQVGRGMLIGLLAAPVTLLIFFPGLIVSDQLGLLG